MYTKPLPWWTWLVPFFVLNLGTLASLPYFTSIGIYWIYFPVNLGIVMSLWWGPRVLISVFLNALIATYLLGLPYRQIYPIYALPETVEVLLSMTLMRERFHSKNIWKSNPKNLSYFVVYCLAIPAVLVAIATQVIFFTVGITSQKNLLWAILMTTVGNLTGAIFICLPLFILLTPILSKKKISLFTAPELPPFRWSLVTRNEKMSLLCVLTGCLILGTSMPLSQSWYLYGIVMLLSSAWYGLYAALIMNTWVMGLSIALPKLLHLPWADDPVLLQTPATLLTLCFCSLIAGSAITSLIEKILVLRSTEADLKAAKELAEEASAAKSEFLARMSHEIRTPLNSVLGMLELLKETQLNSDQSRYLSLFSHAGENLKALINDLLDFSKIEAKALSVENISYDLHSTIRSVFEILQIKAEEKGLHFELNIEKDIPRLQWGDPTRLRQVLFNLIGNALKFTLEGSVEISVKLQKNSSETLVLEVRDTGIGIPREKQNDLFSPFFQADPGTTRKYGGTGLGLVISKNLIEIMGGTIEMKSLAGRGTVFRILLPHHPDLTTTLEKKIHPTYLWSTHPPATNFQILLVDDSEDNRVLMIHYLKNLPFTCDEAINGQEAVDKFKQKTFDLIFMDMQMPIMNGNKATELIRRFERENNRAHTAIIALTATAVIEDLKRAIASGCDAYVVKPVKKSEILEIMSKNLKINSNFQNRENTLPPPSP